MRHEAQGYVGGKRVTNSGEHPVDFLAAVESTDAVVVIEIKTPGHELLEPPYRGRAFPFSRDLTGTVAQALTYRQSLMREAVMANSDSQTTLGEPCCPVVAGKAQQRSASARNERDSSVCLSSHIGVTVVTYDEFFAH